MTRRVPGIAEIFLVIAGVVFLCVVGYQYVTAPHPVSAPPAHEQPQIIPPPWTATTQKEGELHDEPVGIDTRSGNPSSSALATGTGVLRNLDQSTGSISPKREPVNAKSGGQPRTDEASRALTQKAVVVPPKEERWRAKNGAKPKRKSSRTDVAAETTLVSAEPGSSTKMKFVTSAPTRTSTSTGTGANLAAPDPYASDFMGGQWKEDEWTATSTFATVAPEIAGSKIKSRSAVTSAHLAAIGTSTENPLASSACATIAPDYQPACTTANNWYAQIAAHYGSEIGRHYLWLKNNPAFVEDYNVNGCNPSPCDAKFTGRLQPADYAGRLGYDSPLGTCTSTTPTKRMRGAACPGVNTDIGCAAKGAFPVNGVLPGVIGDDGRLHGSVLFNGELYDGVIADPNCTDCVVTFTHPCQLRNWGEQPAEIIGVDGKRAYTWYLGVAQ